MSHLPIRPSATRSASRRLQKCCATGVVRKSSHSGDNTHISSARSCSKSVLDDKRFQVILWNCSEHTLKGFTLDTKLDKHHRQRRADLWCMWHESGTQRRNVFLGVARSTGRDRGAL